MPVVTQAEFQSKLNKLIERASELLRHTPSQYNAKPEELTIDLLIRPLLDALNFDERFRVPQQRIQGEEGLGWVDYMLIGSNRTPLAFVEAKSVWETDIWRRYETQVRQYIRDYHLNLKHHSPVRWLVLTNFRETYIIYMFDRKPFVRITLQDLTRPDKVQDLWAMLERGNLERDTILNKYYESQNIRLGRMFLTDLRAWRQILANGIRASGHMSLQQIKQESGKLLNRLILVRVLESLGIHAYYSIPKEWAHWNASVRNKDAFPFISWLERVIRDLELDLNTDLLRLDSELPKIPEVFLEAVLIPDSSLSSDLAARCNLEPQLFKRALYSYDFRSLDSDVMGAVYEQYLAHDFREDQNGRIKVEVKQLTRQQQGVYYTPPVVARHLVRGALEDLLDSALNEARTQLNKGNYREAHAVMEERVATVRVIDPACGSGTFLMAAMDALLEAYQKYNEWVESIRKSRGELFADGLQRFEQPAEYIVAHQLYGCDKDPEAVEVTRLNLWIKLLRANQSLYTRQNGARPRQRLLSRLPLFERSGGGSRAYGERGDLRQDPAHPPG